MALASLSARRVISATSADCDLCLVVPSDSIHRVQESHVALYHILWDLTHTLLADDRGPLAGRAS